MADGIQILSEKVAVQRIIETVQRSKPGEAPFALVVGSGFSRGLVPLARDLVSEILPRWIKCREDGVPFDSKKQWSQQERDSVSGEFWKKFIKDNEEQTLKLDLDDRNIPRDHAAAYKAAFSHEFGGALGAPALAREFQRELMELSRSRLNAAHFLLASILGAQPTLRASSDDVFKYRAAFSRLILTTNFDPFLQIALQSVGRLYFMSDRPDLGLSELALEDDAQAIHLAYVHGSVHRRFQFANETDLKNLRENNANFLAGILKRRGVIVLGYSGWDDVIVEALAACDKFDHRLYWCGLEENPLQEGAFGQRVPDILRKPSACYVQTKAAPFMAQLFNNLVKGGMPRLLDNPIGQIREMLQSIDLDELDDLQAKSVAASAGHGTPTAMNASVSSAFKNKKEITLKRLEAAESAFKSEPAVAPPLAIAAAAAPAGGGKKKAAPPKTSPVEKSVESLLASISVAESLRNYEEMLTLCDRGLKDGSLSPDEKASLLQYRGVAHYFLNSFDLAIEDWTAITQSADSPPDQVHTARLNRAAAWSRSGFRDKALLDLTRVIEDQPPPSKEELARAFGSRGWQHYVQNDFPAFLRDTEWSLQKDQTLDGAAFNYGLALLSNGRDSEALDAYRAAAQRFRGEIESMGIADVRAAVGKWLSEERARPVIDLLESFKKTSETTAR